MPANVRKRYFTLVQANALLSRLRPRLERMMQLSAHLRSSADGGTTPTPPGTPWMADPVVAAWEAQDPEKSRALAACLYETLSAELQAAEAFGVEIKDLGIGLVELPSYLDGRSEVLLSWTIYDREVRYFHTPHGGYRGRKTVEGHTFLAELGPEGQLRE